MLDSILTMGLTMFGLCVIFVLWQLTEDPRFEEGLIRFSKRIFDPRVKIKVKPANNINIVELDKINAKCALCHDVEPRHYCDRCNTVLHEDCLFELNVGACPVCSRIYYRALLK